MLSISEPREPGAGTAPASNCPRCGAELVPRAQLVRQLGQLVEDGDRARFDLGVAERSVPSSVPAALARLAGLGPDLVAAVRCHLGACGPALPGGVPPPAGGPADEDLLELAQEGGGGC